jgi:adenylosuccinate synthase
MPYEFDAKIEPVYQEFKGWNTSLAEIRSEADFPAELVDYIRFIEMETGVPVKIVSVGPDREATIKR